MFPICENVITQANILFCIYGDMGKVIENACACDRIGFARVRD